MVIQSETYKIRTKQKVDFFIGVGIPVTVVTGNVKKKSYLHGTSLENSCKTQNGQPFKDINKKKSK